MAGKGRGQTGAVSKLSPTSSIVSQPTPSGNQSGATGSALGATHNPIYRSSSSEYVPVRENDLKEISEFGWLEEGLGALGVFFASGAFWTAAPLLFDLKNLKQNTSELLFCMACLLFGGALLWVAHMHFRMKRRRIEDYFKSPSP